MDNKLMISVVIPVYNAEKFIRRAIDSVLSQMNGEVELILVNDGSKDNSGAICDEYSRSNPQIHVIHQANAGPCVARNAGIKAASGEYIMFLDSDDYFAPNACAEVTKVIRAHHPDFIDFGWYYVNWDGEITSNLHAVPKNVLHGNDVVRNVVLPRMLHLQEDDKCFINEFACTKVFCRRIMMENAVFFDESRRTWEDRPFVACYLKYCRNFYAIDQCLYYYAFSEGSLSQWYCPDYFRIIIVTFQYYRRLYEDEFDFDTQFINDYWCSAIENMIDRSLRQTKDQNMIRENILTTLRDKQVIYWYTNRQPQDAFEKKVNALVVAGDVEEALRAYEKKAVQKHRQERVNKIFGRIKGCLRGALRRITGR